MKQKSEKVFPEDAATVLVSVAVRLAKRGDPDRAPICTSEKALAVLLQQWRALWRCSHRHVLLLRCVKLPQQRAHTLFCLGRLYRVILEILYLW